MSESLSKKRKGNENDDSILHSSPRTLLDLASIKLAFNIWLDKFAELYPGGPDDYIAISHLQFDAENLIQVPSAVKKMIELWLPVITKELDIWFQGFQYALHNLRYEDFYSRLNLVVFGGNGTVHFKDTIENFFEDDSLNDLVKFEIACVYCIEEKVDFFWPLVRDQFRIEDMQFYIDYSTYYWICRKKGELNRIPLEEFSSIEHYMIDRCSALPIWLAIEYFLARLNPNDRFDQIDRLFDYGGRVEYARYLLPNFEASMQRHLIQTKSIDILAAFVEHSSSLDYAIQVWSYIKDFITGEQFYDEIILRFIYERNRNYVFYSNKFEYGYVETVLVEIWSDSPSHLKAFIFSYHFPDILQQLADCRNCRSDFLKNSSRDISFTLAILSDADFDSRKKYWHENWSKWIEGVSSAQLDRIMAVCLVNAEDIETFRSNLKDSKVLERCFDTLITRGFHTALNDLLSYFYTDEREVLEMKMKLLTTNDIWKNHIFKPKTIEQIQKFVQFVDKLFSYDMLPDDFKNRLLSIKDDLNFLYDLSDSCTDIKLVADTVILPEKLEEFKAILWAMFRNTIIKGDLFGFNDSNCQNFFNWFANEDKQQIETSKKLLPIENIFQTALRHCLEHELYAKIGIISFSNMCRFRDLNKFIEWYFESTDSSENFKRERIRYYEGMSTTDIESIFCMDKESAVESMKRDLLNRNFERHD